MEKVREQLTLQNHDGSPSNGSMSRVLDLKTGTVKKDAHASGARLSKFIVNKNFSENLPTNVIAFFLL